MNTADKIPSSKYLEQLVSIISKEHIEYVFIDLFDTIILRKHHPLYVIRLWANKVLPYLHLNIDDETLYEIRRRCFEVVSDRISDGFDKEPRYYDIVKELFNVLVSYRMFSKSMPFDKFYHICINAEIEIEYSMQYIDMEIVEILKYCVLNNIKVVCILDFYMPRQAIESLLTLHGLRDYIGDVFISSDYHLSKASGNLFKLVLDTYKLEPNKAVMIGDNKKSDYINALKEGMHAIHIKRMAKRLTDKLKLVICLNRNVQKVIAKYAKKCLSSSYFYSEYIIMFYTFTFGLFTELHKRGITDVIFLSREGYFLKKLFDVYQDKVGLKCLTQINSHYLHISRAAAIVSTLDDLSKEQFEPIFSFSDNISIYSFLMTLGFTQDKIKEILRNLNVDGKRVINGFSKSKLYDNLLNEPTFQRLYDDIKTKQAACFEDYISSYKLDFSKGLAIVDVGWKGTMQDRITKHFNNKISVSGFYLGLFGCNNCEENNSKAGILFSDLPLYSQYYDLFS